MNLDARADQIVEQIRIAIARTNTLVEREDDEYPQRRLIGDLIEVVVAFDFVGDEKIPVTTEKTGSEPALIVVNETYRGDVLLEYRYNLEDTAFGDYFEAFQKHPEADGTFPHHQISGRSYRHRETRRWEVSLDEALPWLIKSYYENRLGPAIRGCEYCRQEAERERAATA